MPGKVKVKIISGKNLPVMDRSSDTTDAYVEIKLANTTYKTDVCRRTLNPQWNTDWFRFEVDDSELQDEPLQIRLMDHDTYSANDAIGKVYLNLNPLLLPVSGQFAIGDNNPHHEISGWIPVFDTMHGIRGEVNVTVKVELFSDFNRFRQSSCGFHFFYSSTVPQGYQAKIINGFVEELIVNDDPEYQWIDKIRTPRASNEARQTLFLKLSGELQRKIGLKAHGLGGNAVIGYKQNFDLEGESGIVARGIGTAVTLVKASNVLPVTTEFKEELIDNYLKFVGDGKSFSFGSTSPLLQKLPPFLTENLNSVFPNLTHHSITKSQSTNSNISPSLSNPDIHKGETNIRVLLNQEDKRGLSAMSRRLQKFKHSQKSLSKKMIALKAKLNDSIGEETEESQEVARDKRSLFKRATSDSSAMAEILARSVMKATSSLSSILEDHPVEDETLKKLDPIANLLHQSESEMCSDAHSSDSDTSSSSDYEYTDYSGNNNDVETISNIITNVEKLQRCLSREALHKQYSLPCIPTKGFSLSSIDKLEGSDYEKYRFGGLTKQRGSSSSFSSSHSYEFGDDFDRSKPVQRAHKLERSKEIDLPDAVLDQSEDIVFPIYNNNFSTKEDESFSRHEMTDSALKTMLIDPAKLLVTQPISPEFSSTSKHERKADEEPKGLVKTALQTMLAERAKIIDKNLPVSEFCLKNPVPPSQDELPKPNTITNIALQAMLVERANIMGTDANTNQRSNSIKSTHKIQLESTGLVKTALQTMLAEKASIVNTVANYDKNQSKSKNPLHLSLANDLGNAETPNSISLPSSNTSKTEFEYQKKSPVSPNLSTLSSSSILKPAFKYPSPSTDDVKVIAKVNLDKVKVQSNKIVKTAMQTMLLEKFKLLGTYTPPTSPSLLPTHAQTFTFNEKDEIRSIPKSASAASFGEYQRPTETVLGMPFKSLSSLLTEYESGIQQSRFNLITDQNNDGAKKKRFKFLQSNGKMFQRINRLSRREPKEANILTRMFQQRTEAKFKDADTQTYNDLPQNSSSNCICPTKIIITTYKPPGELDLASGDFLAHSKTKSACITSHNSSPAQERQDENDTEKKDELSPSHGVRLSHSPVKVNYMVPIHRRSSDSDLSITPKGSSLTGSDKSTGNAATYLMRSNYVRRHNMKQEPYDMLEYPFMTMTKFPARFIIQIGGSISARSVKLLERISNVDEPQSRDTWWSEIRMEIRSHARSLNCNAVLGYTELTSICEDVCVLSAYGTAAVIDYNNTTGEDDVSGNMYSATKNIERDKNINGQPRQQHESPDHRFFSCYVTHVPYDEKGVPLKAKVSKCPMCLVGKVPEVLISTIEPPEMLPSVGKGCFIESHVSRSLKDLRGETIAKEISDGLPFLEYELHRLLVNRLKIKGMNAIFGLKIRISVGEKMLVGVATGTAIFLPSLPSPDLPLLVTDKVSDEKYVANLQEILNQTVKKNKEIYQIKDDNLPQKGFSDEDSDDEQASLDISCGNKDCCILEMDDPDDAEVLRLLVQEKIPDGFHVVSTESVPGLEDLEIVKNLQMFTQIYRAKLTQPYNLQKHFVRLLQSVYFKLRRMVPCALCDLQFRIDIPEPDEIQLYVIGMALGLGIKSKKTRMSMEPKKTDEDLIFNLDDEQPPEGASIQLNKSNTSTKLRSHRSPSKHRAQSVKLRNVPLNERHGVDITPLSYVPGGHIEQYLGNLNFFFIRETNSIREEGGLSGFIHSFMTEVLAMVRSHVTALRGNALVAFFMTECVLNHSLHKNQGQCLINVGGDVVSVSYFKDDIQ